MKKIGTILLVLGILGMIGGFIGVLAGSGRFEMIGSPFFIAILGWYMRNRQEKQQ